jgi:TonB family protein
VRILPLVSAALIGAQPVPDGAAERSWRVDWADARCTLIWEQSAETRRLLSLDVIPGSGLLRLRLVDSGWSDYAAAEAAGMPVSLDPGGAVAGTGARPIRNATGGGVEIHGVEDTALAAFAAARSIGMGRDGRSVFRLQLPGAGAAVASLRKCEEDALRRWGIDPAARASLRRLPKPVGGSPLAWFRWQDYPKQAMRERASGAAVARVDVDPSGKPVRCAVVASAGHAALDRVTCDSVMKRARFEPALNAAGEPVAFHYIIRAVWSMP